MTIFARNFGAGTGTEAKESRATEEILQFVMSSTPDFLPAEPHRRTDETKLSRSIAKYLRFNCLAFDSAQAS
jgi:hypothetical protein